MDGQNTSMMASNNNEKNEFLYVAYVRSTVVV